MMEKEGKKNLTGEHIKTVRFEQIIRMDFSGMDKKEQQDFCDEVALSIGKSVHYILSESNWNHIAKSDYH